MYKSIKCLHSELFIIVLVNFCMNRVRIGEVFVQMSNEEAQIISEKELAQARESLSNLTTEVAHVQADMDILKVSYSQTTTTPYKHGWTTS